MPVISFFYREFSLECSNMRLNVNYISVRMRKLTDNRGRKCDRGISEYRYEILNVLL